MSGLATLGRCLASAGIMAGLDDHTRSPHWPVSFDRTWVLLEARTAARTAMAASPRCRGRKGPRVWWATAHTYLDSVLR